MKYEKYAHLFKDNICGFDLANRYLINKCNKHLDFYVSLIYLAIDQ